MTKTYLKIAALVIALAPNVAAAQSAVSTPAMPGSGYQMPSTPRTNTQPPVAYDGYRISAGPRDNEQLMSAYAPHSDVVPSQGYPVANAPRDPSRAGLD
jgi:hypothetical protein